MSVMRAAAVQAAPVFLDRDATIEKAVDLIAEAAAGGAQLVAFPETWIPGYPAWIFGAAGWDDPAEKRAFRRLNQNAVEVPSLAVDELCRAAKEAGVVVAMGMTERDARSSRAERSTTRSSTSPIRARCSVGAVLRALRDRCTPGAGAPSGRLRACRRDGCDRGLRRT
jgi:predicted amidohydrolase